MLGTRLFTWWRGREVGRDASGNRYFQERSRRPGDLRPRRWVIYAGGREEASLVPAEWHSWLHYTTDEPLTGPRYPWQKPHQPNLTGTPLAYRPKGHDYRGGRRQRTTGDYDAWSPES